MIKCSILIPVYNQEILIKKCIESIPKRDDIEIIVVDDKSTDNTIQTVTEYSNVILIKNEKNLGIGLTRQKLLDAATGEYIYFIDSDDYMYTDAFNELLDHLEEDYDVIESMRRKNNNQIYHSVVWQGAFIKASIAKSVKYKDVKCHEDTYWKADIIAKYPNLKIKLFEDKILYHYNYPRVGSLTYMDKHQIKTNNANKTFIGGGYFGL